MSVPPVLQVVLGGLQGQGVGGVGVVCEDVKDASAIDQETIFAQNQDL